MHCKSCDSLCSYKHNGDLGFRNNHMHVQSFSLYLLPEEYILFLQTHIVDMAAIMLVLLEHLWSCSYQLNLLSESQVGGLEMCV